MSKRKNTTVKNHSYFVPDDVIGVIASYIEEAQTLVNLYAARKRPLPLARGLEKIGHDISTVLERYSVDISSQKLATKILEDGTMWPDYLKALLHYAVRLPPANRLLLLQSFRDNPLTRSRLRVISLAIGEAKVYTFDRIGWGDALYANTLSAGLHDSTRLRHIWLKENGQVKSILEEEIRVIDEKMKTAQERDALFEKAMARIQDPVQKYIYGELYHGVRPKKQEKRTLCSNTVLCCQAVIKFLPPNGARDSFGELAVKCNEVWQHISAPELKAFRQRCFVFVGSKQAAQQAHDLYLNTGKNREKVLQLLK
jgi:hypothetical protein